MFADTITITINANAKVLNRINQDGYSSEYFLREATGEFRLRLRNTSYTDKTRSGLKVDRHNVELVQTLYPAVPTDPSKIRKWYTVFENDNGDTIVDPAKFVVGGAAFLTEANVTKLLNWES